VRGFLRHRLFREIRERLTFPVSLLVTILIVGTAGFKIIGWREWGWLDCAFMTAITLTTVGYGDALGVGQHPGATVFTIIIMFVGMGIVLYNVSTITAFLVEGGLTLLFKERRMLKEISGMRDHYIVAGAGSTGIHVVDEMHKTGAKFVVIEGNADKIAHMEDTYKGLRYIQGDATDDANLINAGVERAKGLVACLSNDKDNLYITVSAKSLNPRLTVVARAIRTDMKEKFLRVGANYVVSPNQIGGMRMASEILRPHVVTFLDRMLRAKDSSIRIGEVAVEAGSRLDGKALKNSRIPEETGLLVIAVQPSEEEDAIYNPKADQVLKKGCVIIVIGSYKALQKLQSMASA
jgi:voltage-gated potassium channel